MINYLYCGNAHDKITRVIPMEPANAKFTNLKINHLKTLRIDEYNEQTVTLISIAKIEMFYETMRKILRCI